MRTGKTLQEMAAELERQQANVKDYIASQHVLHAIVEEAEKPEVRLAGLNGKNFGITQHAHQQLGTFLGIPKPYYDRMMEKSPDLLVANINVWLLQNGEEKRMVRTLDGKARAFLSSKFRPLDNFDLAQAVIPKLIELGVQVMSAELTETRMYIKGILPSLSDEAPEGGVWGEGHGNARGRIVAAITISNSEVGAGSLRVEPSVFTTFCTNLAVLKAAAMRKYHVGRAHDAGEDLEIFRDETRVQDDKAFFMKVEDITVKAFDKQAFEVAVSSLRNAAAMPIVSEDLAKVVEVTTKRLALPDGLRGGILTHLAKGGSLTKWGLSSAITMVANTAPTYELATELEHAGGEVLAWDGPAWQAVSEAA